MIKNIQRKQFREWQQDCQDQFCAVIWHRDDIKRGSPLRGGSTS